MDHAQPGCRMGVDGGQAFFRLDNMEWGMTAARRFFNAFQKNGPGRARGAGGFGENSMSKSRESC